MMKNFNKGQAALEFLTTYGWAFLVILVMIAALSYFGVLDASRFVPNSCKLDGNIECPAYSIDTSTNEVQIAIQSNVPDDISIVRLKIKEKEFDTWCTSANLAPGAGDIPSRDQADMLFDFSGDTFINCDIQPDEKKSYDLQVFYTRGTSSSIENLAAGSMTTTPLSS